MDERQHDSEIAFGFREAVAPRRPATASTAGRVDRNVFGLLGGLAGIGLALLLYRAGPELGFAVVCGVSAATGWRLSRQAVEAICVAEALALTAAAWAGGLPWWTAIVQLAVAAGLAVLARLAAQGALNRRVSLASDRRLHALSFLLETAEFLATTRDQGVILNTAVHASARGISRSAGAGAAHAAFHAVEGEQVRITLVEDEPRSRVLATGFEYQLARNQAARAAIRTGRPAIVRPDHLNGDLRSLADDLGWHVMIMAPVYCGGSLQGLLAATARDGPAVDQLQQFMLGRLARFTSASLDSAAARTLSIPEAVQISPQKTDQAAEVTPSLLSREVGLAALEHDVVQSRLAQARSHCLAVLRVPKSEDSEDGGELIRLVAERLRSYLRRDDLIFKYADDEIVCSFADTAPSDVQTILNRVQSELAREIGYVPFAIGLTSVGAAPTAS